MSEPVMEKIDNRPPVIPVMLWPGAFLYVPREDEDDVAALLKSEREMIYEPGEPDVRRVLDLGANVGEFSVYCRLRWPQAWVDCIEEDEMRADLCSLNAAPGTRMLQRVDSNAQYDLIRITEGWEVRSDHWGAKIVFFDGVRGNLQPPWTLVATGMRRKNQPFEWWCRK